MTAGRGEGGGELEALEARLGHRFRDRSVLVRALTHRSFAHERPASRASGTYERLEFLGDALLGFLISERLLADDPEASEGTLSRRRQSVVREDTLAGVAEGLGLGEALRLGRGELQTGGRTKRSLLADVFEAVLCAVYLDGGLRAARAFVRRHLGAFLRAVREPASPPTDYKTVLQEHAQSRLHRTPRYRIVGAWGPAHQPRFRAEVSIDGRVLGTGTGSSRKLAEQGAAREALGRLEATENEAGPS